MADPKKNDAAKSSVEAKAKAELKKIEVLVVKSVADGFRRIGLAFTREAQHLDASVLTDEQKAALASDPALSVTTATVTVAAAGTAANPVVTPVTAPATADEAAQ